MNTKVERDLIVVEVKRDVIVSKGNSYDKVSIIGDVHGEPGKKLVVEAFGQNAATFKTMVLERGTIINVELELVSREGKGNYAGRWFNSFNIVGLKVIGEFTEEKNVQTQCQNPFGEQPNPFENQSANNTDLFGQGMQEPPENSLLGQQTQTFAQDTSIQAPSPNDNPFGAPQGEEDDGLPF